MNSQRIPFLMHYYFYLTDPFDYISFYSKSKDRNAALLSNFSIGQVDIDFSKYFNAPGVVLWYPTGEHAFQGSKFKVIAAFTAVEQRKEELLTYAAQFESSDTHPRSHFLNPAAAKRGGRVLRLTPDELELWACHSQDIQIQICESKIVHNERIAAYLLSTGESYLLHFERSNSWPDYGGSFLKPENSPFQDGKMWLKGNNRLGQIWMDIRSRSIHASSSC
jgi:predicted NAD-dependent protein-ADP-ribosyltransferase YbiA (DUF1768 family)